MNTYRIPKYHVWDKYLNKFIDFYSINKLVFEDPTYIFLQFTGFYDINQTEIYEGDVVAWPHDPELEPRHVLFDQEMGFWRLSGDSYDGFDDLALALNGINDAIKVIGNILENPLTS